MFLYVHKYPPARPSEANFALPEPARSPKSQKKPGSSPPEARKLEARTSLISFRRLSDVYKIPPIETIFSQTELDFNGL